MTCKVSIPQTKICRFLAERVQNPKCVHFHRSISFCCTICLVVNLRIIKTFKENTLQAQTLKPKSLIRLTHYLKLPGSHTLSLWNPIESHCPLPARPAHIARSPSLRPSKLGLSHSAWEVRGGESLGEGFALTDEVVCVAESERCCGNVKNRRIGVSSVSRFNGVNPIFLRM